MRTLQRILFERRTRRFLDEMIHKYADIRLSAATRQMASRKRQRSGVDKAETNQLQRPSHGRDPIERSSSSSCRTASERSTCVSSTLRHTEHDQLEKGHARLQQMEASPRESWRVSASRTASEFSSVMSSTRLTRLAEDEEAQGNQCSSFSCRRLSSSSTSSMGQAEDNQEHCSSFYDCDTVSAYDSAPNSTSTQPSEGNQAETLSELMGCETPSSSPPQSATATLPTLQPTPPGVIPNCCDYFTSPHPHYPKEKIGLGKDDEVSDAGSSRTNSTCAESIGEVDDHDTTDHRTTEVVERSGYGDEFEMWDYVCPQYARHHYANEWV